MQKLKLFLADASGTMSKEMMFFVPVALSLGLGSLAEARTVTEKATTEILAAFETLDAR